LEASHLLYLAIGDADLAAQASYAAYSALAHQGHLDLSIHICTDRGEAFAALRDKVEIREVSAATIREWRGPGNYPYRMKIAALREMARQFPDQKVLFADSDTFFVADIAPAFERIRPSLSVMHRREYAVASHPTGQLRRFRKHMAKRSFRGGSIDVDADMWNSGAIGVHPRNLYLLDTVLAFIDALAPRYKKQLLEQFAVSYYLQKNTVVEACDDVLFHYWAQKPDYQRRIEPRLARWRDLPLHAALEELRANPIIMAAFVRRHGWVRRMRDRLLGA
jgi:hypothetical protein